MYRPTHISASAPTVNDDYSAGFRAANFWWDTSADTFYILVDDATGAADWVSVGGGGIYRIEELGVTANTTFVIPEGYLLQTITVIYNSGTDVKLMFGKTAGGDDIGETLAISGTPITITKNIDLADSGDFTVYVTISGTTPNVDIHVILIKNRIT